MNENNSNWKAPTNIIALIGLFVSISMNIHQCSSGKKKLEQEKIQWEDKFELEEKQWQQEFVLQKEKWNLEQQKIQNELNKYTREEKFRENSSRELEDINRQIAILLERVSEDEIELLNKKLKINSPKTGPNLKKALQSNLVRQQEKIDYKKKEIERLEKRKNTLEGDIRNK